jgi:hypothetical protein
MEADGDYRGAVLATREARECLLSANELLVTAEALKGAGRTDALGPVSAHHLIAHLMRQSYGLRMKYLQKAVH